MKLMKTYNLFRTITKFSGHCANYLENSDLSLEKCVKSIEKNCSKTIRIAHALSLSSLVIECLALPCLRVSSFLVSLPSCFNPWGLYHEAGLAG